MESERDVQEQLLEVERGEAAAWIDYPPTPRWWAPIFGLYAAAVVLVNAFLGSPWNFFGSLALVGVSLGLIRWDRTRRGTYPQRNSPRELNRPFFFLGLAVVAVVATGAATLLLAGPWASALVSGGLAWATVEVYERMYAAAAHRARVRLGMAVGR